MADEMALFEAELGKMASPKEDKQVDAMQVASIENGCADATQEQETQEPEKVQPELSLAQDSLKRGYTGQSREDEINGMKESQPKVSLAQEAVRRWKQRRIDEELALEEAGKGAWTEHKDPDSGASYYYNTVTKTSSWTRPPDFVKPSAGSAEPFVVATTSKWTVSKDPSSGLLYYFNRESGQSTWERPADFNEVGLPTLATPTTAAEAVTPAATATVVATESATSGATANGASHASARDWDVDEVIDLVATTKASEFSASHEVRASVAAESEEGISVVGFTLRLNTQFVKLMEAWSDYQELPFQSVYFESGGRLLAPLETPGHLGWTQGHGILKIEAKPCEEVTDEEAEEVARSKKKQKKKAKKHEQQPEFITEY